MIEKVIHGDALYAREEMLLVPVPSQSVELDEGFAGSLARLIPYANMRFRSHGGLHLGEMMIVGSLAGDSNWTRPYSVVFTALHDRRERGWEYAPLALDTTLSELVATYGPDRQLATAGIPGTGYSGLKGDAIPIQIKSVLENTVLPVTVYDREFAGDREPLEYAEPSLSAGAVLNV